MLTIASVLLEFGFPTEEHHLMFESIPLFYSMLGFFGCILMIVVPKLLGAMFLIKEEDYYNAD